jgi:hypothetical protein
MSRIAFIAAFIALTSAGSALAQTSGPSFSPGTVEASIMPGGGLFFTEGKDTQGPGFGNYTLGGSVTVNVTRYVGIEGEVSGALGITQDLDFNGVSLPDLKTPNLLSYNGNVVLHAGRGPIVPYATGGIGGLSFFERPEVGINDTQTFLAANVGGGIKWYGDRFGIRGDYRLIVVQSQDDAPAFFGQETRYGHRFSGAVIINLTR